MNLDTNVEPTCEGFFRFKLFLRKLDGLGFEFDMVGGSCKKIISCKKVIYWEKTITLRSLFPTKKMI